MLNFFKLHIIINIYDKINTMAALQLQHSKISIFILFYIRFQGILQGCYNQGIVVLAPKKRQLIEQENIFTNFTSDKELMAGIYKELKKFNNNKAKNSVKKWAKAMSRPI